VVVVLGVFRVVRMMVGMAMVMRKMRRGIVVVMTMRMGRVIFLANSLESNLLRSQCSSACWKCSYTIEIIFPLPSKCVDDDDEGDGEGDGGVVDDGEDHDVDDKDEKEGS
jgi:hypothetical protein